MFKKIKRLITKKYLKKYFNINLKDLEKNRNNQDNLNTCLEKCFNKSFLYLENISNKVSFIEKVIKEKFANDNKIYSTNILGENYLFWDGIFSNTVEIVSGELNQGNEYDFTNIDFKEGDCVIDIGGNIGMISIYLAKKFPFLKIYAFEPVRENYENFLKNIKLNNIPDGTIIVENKAVTKDGRMINMRGGSSISDVIPVGAATQEENCNIESITLEEIFKKHNIGKLKLLKIDCEGSEYEILYNTKPEILKSIEYVRGEFHENKELTDEYDVDKLLSFLEQYVKNIDIVKARACFIM